MSEPKKDEQPMESGDGIGWLHELNRMRKLLDERSVENLKLIVENAEHKRLWLAEQKARLEQNSFVEMYSAAQAKVRIDELEAENASLLDDNTRLRGQIETLLFAIKGTEAHLAAIDKSADAG